MQGSNKLDLNSLVSASWGNGYIGGILLAVTLQVMTPSTSSAHELRDANEHRITHHLAGPKTNEPERDHVYYRPFCRRSHYVTNRSAPCLN
jgi:hypothetical protein